ncbi:MAG: hypothetical protein HQK86_14950 [Nitrospinae bacterium]|nr:hypothetical protein [Nitrospinota bacterium]MBF0634194.1 hypothetical protein [Nitrospinota bacterium]
MEELAPHEHCCIIKANGVFFVADFIGNQSKTPPPDQHRGISGDADTSHHYLYQALEYPQLRPS